MALQRHQLIEAHKAIASVSKKHPNLGEGGYDSPLPLTDDLVPEVACALAFLRLCRHVKQTRAYSYALKHTAERWGEVHLDQAYVCNGALICAALYLPLRVRRGDKKSLNAFVGVSIPSVRALSEKTRKDLAIMRGAS